MNYESRMDFMRNDLPWLLVLVVSLFGFSYVAFAADVPTTARAAEASGGEILYWIPVIIPVLALAAAQLRRWTPATGFWHTVWGHAFITFAGAILAGTAGWLEQRTLTVEALLTALGGALASWAGAFKPTGIGNGVPNGYELPKK